MTQYHWGHPGTNITVIDCANAEKKSAFKMCVLETKLFFSSKKPTFMHHKTTPSDDVSTWTLPEVEWSSHFFRSWNDQATLAHDLTIWPEADYYMASSIADGQQATPEPNISQMFHKAISFISHTYHEIILYSHWHSSSTHQAWKALPASTIYTFISLSMTVNNIQCFSTLQLSVHHPCECLRRLR